MEFTSKRMRHKSKKVTAYHYIESFEDLNVTKYTDMCISEILSDDSQTRLQDFI